MTGPWYWDALHGRGTRFGHAGAMLHVETTGEGARLVLLHGFTQNARCWGRFGADIGRSHEAVFVDLPGHGESGHDSATLEEAAALVAEVGGRGTYLGYSLGGRVALHVAIRFPELVERLVLIGATAGLRTDGERQARIQADEALASSIESDGLDEFLTRWLAQPLFAGLTDEAASLPQRRANRAEAMTTSLRSVGTGRQADLWPALDQIGCPTLVVTGAADAKFTAIGQEMRQEIGMCAELVVLDSVGHSVHLEAPQRTCALLRDWLDRTERRNMRS